MSALAKPASTFVPTASTRRIILDTETTGLNPKTDRIISIGLVEMDNFKIGKTHEWFFNPGDVEISPEAMAVHGITPEFLADKPKIKSRLADILGLLHEALAGGHNVNFDINFIEEELRRNGFPSLKDFIVGVEDTMQMSREKWPGKAASLDALCDRVGVARGHRVTHGALTDALLCAEAMIAMRREQTSFDIFNTTPAANDHSSTNAEPYADVIVIKASAEEQAAHLSYLDGMRKDAGGVLVWDQYEEEAEAGTAPAL